MLYELYLNFFNGSLLIGHRDRRGRVEEKMSSIWGMSNSTFGLF